MPEVPDAGKYARVLGIARECRKKKAHPKVRLLNNSTALMPDLGTYQVMKAPTLNVW